MNCNELYLQSADRFQVLGLSRDRIQLFEGNRNALDKLEPMPGDSGLAATYRH